MQTQLAAKQTLPRKRPTFLFFGGEGAASTELQLGRSWQVSSKQIKLRSRNVKQKPSSCNEKLHEKMAANVAMDQPHGDGEEDSPSTDPEMPPLIPVCSNPAEPAVAPKTARQVLAAQLEVLNGRARGRGRGRKTKGKAKSESSESISAPPILVGPGTSTPGASPKTVDFSRRAGDLAAMLDQLPAPSLEENSVPRKAKHWTDKALEEIEVTAAANAKAAASRPKICFKKLFLYIFVAFCLKQFLLLLLWLLDFCKFMCFLLVVEVKHDSAVWFWFKGGRWGVQHLMQTWNVSCFEFECFFVDVCEELKISDNAKSVEAHCTTAQTSQQTKVNRMNC